MVDAATRREDFPALQREVNGHPLAYLDNAATTQKPEQVIDAVADYYRERNANVHRCVHALGEEATAAYDTAHRDVARFIGADDWREIVFTKNATEAANLLAYSYGMHHVDSTDSIVLTAMDHHSMIVPWQQVADRTGADLRYVDITADGRLDMNDLRSKVDDDTAVVGGPHVSNVLGTVNPAQEIATIAHEHGAKCFLDGAQSVPHMPMDVQELGCDALVFSGHKLCGPTGIGVLYADRELLEAIPPFLYGGDMIKRVDRESAEWNDLPWKFEAGTPNVAGAVGLSAAIDYLTDVGMDAIRQHSKQLSEAAYEQLSALDDVTVYGPEDRLGVAAFSVPDAHPHDLSTLLNEQGIAIRGGHHCAQPLGDELGVSSTARASVYLYNTMDEIDRLTDAVAEAAAVFNG